jgi:hypothetical protein
MTWKAAGYAGLAGIGMAIGAGFVAPVVLPFVLSTYAIYSIASLGFGFI